MEKYEHGGDIYGNPGVKLDFSVSVNPLGMPVEVRKALIAHVDEYARYPDPHCRGLRAAIAAHEDVAEDRILCGNGAADLIYRLCYAIQPRKALVCAPTFSEYERALEQVGCETAHYALAPDHGFAFAADMADRLSPGVDVLFLCHPNNPTGRLVPEDVLEFVLCRAGQNHTRVVVDECFLDFTSGVSSKKYLNKIPGLVVLKAFTKTYAMAGLRLGYMLTADGELLGRANGAAQCWSVSAPAQIAGAAALACDGWLDRTRRLVAEERVFMTEGLGRLGISVFPGDANFILFRCEQPLYAPLLRQGILIRPCENFVGLDGSYYRIGLKTRPQNRSLLQALDEILHGEISHGEIPHGEISHGGIPHGEALHG